MEQQLLIFSLLFEKKKTNCPAKTFSIDFEQPNCSQRHIVPLDAKFNAELHCGQFSICCDP
jgi:hypothetical protein